MDDREDKHEVDNITQSDNCVKQGAVFDAKVLIKIGEHIRGSGVSKEEVPRHSSEGVNRDTKEGGNSCDAVHGSRGADAKLRVDGLHIEMANESICHDGQNNKEVEGS